MKMDIKYDNPDAIERILATEEELIPTSGFAALVMERVHTEAAAPEPIPFPWKRALPGMAAAACAIGVELAISAHRLMPMLHGLTLTMPVLPASTHLPLEQAGWIALSLGASLGAWIIPARMMRRT